MTKLRFACFNLSNAEQVNLFDINTYSLFKYGSVEATTTFADKLGKLINSQIPTIADGTWLIASAAYKVIPTASFFLVQSLNKVANFGQQLDQIHIVRDTVYPDDYALWNAAQRQFRIDQINLTFPKEQLQGKNLLIVDDALVTGAHEKILYEQLSPYTQTICFAYIVDLKELKTETLESSFNNASVKSIVDLDDVIENGPFQLNARTVKYLLGYHNSNHFHYFLMRRSPEFIAEFYESALEDGYSQMLEFERNMILLRRHHKKIVKALAELSLSL